LILRETYLSFFKKEEEEEEEEEEEWEGERGRERE
jgi:hypothetical protein